MRIELLRMIGAFAAVAVTSMASLSVEAGETCDKDTSRALVPFVGDWSFTTKHDGVVGAPTSAGVGTLTIGKCGAVSGLQVGALAVPHFEIEASLSGHVSPFEKHMIRGTLTVVIEAVLEPEEGFEFLVGTEATGDLVCVGMLRQGHGFMEARCIDTSEEAGGDETNLLTEFVMKRTNAVGSR